MKKYMKAVGLTAALAVAIPLSANAAAGAGSDAVQEQVQAQAQTQTQMNSGAAQLQSAVSGAASQSDVSEAASQSAVSESAQTPPSEGKLGGSAHRGYRAGFGHGGIVSQDVLDLLKLDKASLKEKLAAGKTLAEIAEEQGISRDRLKQALTDAFNKKQEEMKQSFADNLDKIIDGKRKAGTGNSFGRGFPGKSDLSAIASALGVTNEELKEALASGKTIADLAKEKGVDTQKLIDAQKAAIIDRINQAVKDGKLTQEQADKRVQKAGTIAENIVNGSGFGRGDRRLNAHD